MYVFVNIGSNLGDRRLNLSRAVRLISEVFGPFEVSHAIESEPWGYDSIRQYLNIGMMFQTELSPGDILHKLQEIEKCICPDAHRDSGGGYKDRVIDIDIVAIGELIINTPELQVPHPHISERRFYLEPMAELAPLWHHPISGLTCSEMLKNMTTGNETK